MTSAWLIISRLRWPSSVKGSAATSQLSTWTVTCLGTIPSFQKKGPVGASSSSPMLYSSSPQSESGQAEVMTATLGQSVTCQSNWHASGRTGFPVSRASLLQAGLLSYMRMLPKRKILTGQASHTSSDSNRYLLIKQYTAHQPQTAALLPRYANTRGNGNSTSEMDFYQSQSPSLFEHFLILYSHNLQMSFLSGGSQDDYKNDVKPDQQVGAFGEAFSSIAWATNMQNVFAATAWDGDLRVFEVANGAYGPAILQKLRYRFPCAALKCTWNDIGTHIYVGLMDGSIKVYDLSSGQTMDIGRHGAAISGLHFVPGQNVIISTAYEPTINFWQPGNPSPVLTLQAENKVFSSDFQFPMLVAGTANERIMIVDINNTNSRSLVDSLDLGKFSQIQSVAINLKGTTFGIASFDGRANLSSIIKNSNGLYTSKSVITFKSNKQEQSGNTILYPINASSFNPVNERWFMTAGSDGGMHFWDFEAKNKIKTLSYGGFPICCAKVSPKGDMIAYGLGNDWHLGQEGEKWQTKLGVHLITEAETKFNK